MARHAATPSPAGALLNAVAEATLTPSFPLGMNGGAHVAPISLDNYIRESMMILEIELDMTLSQG